MRTHMRLLLKQQIGGKHGKIEGNRRKTTYPNVHKIGGNNRVYIKQEKTKEKLEE